MREGTKVACSDTPVCRFAIHQRQCACTQVGGLRARQFTCLPNCFRISLRFQDQHNGTLTTAMMVMVVVVVMVMVMVV